jgi:hypothetical protein
VTRAGTAVEAELYCLCFGLSEVVTRWTSLNEYLDTLIAHDFMELKSYWKFLFDDESFTLSRKYFWAIGCLGEFIGYISDNIRQWDLYYEARLQPFREMGNLADLLQSADVTPMLFMDGAEPKAERLRDFEDLIYKGRKHRDALANLQTQFENKLETFKSLRDGVSCFHYGSSDFSLFTDILELIQYSGIALQCKRSDRKQSIH